MAPALTLVSFAPIFGGGEVFYERLAQLLGNDFEIHALVHNSTLAERLEAQGVRVQRLTETSAWGRIRDARRALKELALRAEVHVVHLNGQAEANLVPFCQHLGLQTVVARHTDLAFQSNFLKRWMYRRNAARAHAVVCVSRYLASQHKGFVSPEKIHVIPHWMQRLDVVRRENTQFTVLYVGRLEKSKGVLELARAARQLPDVEFVLAGEGVLREGLTQGGLKNLRFAGFVRDLAPLYMAADLLVQPSHAEGSSLVALEAMANGVPCLLSDIPALRELAEGGAAALFRCADAVALAEGIRRLQNSPAARTTLARLAGESLEREHSPEAARAQYRAILVGESQGREVCREEQEAVE